MGGRSIGFFDKNGWHKTQGFPAVILEEQGNNIDGYLFSSDELLKNWQLILHIRSDYLKVL